MTAALFTEDGTYAWGPFDEPTAGREAIRAAWNYATNMDISATGRTAE